MAFNGELSGLYCWVGVHDGRASVLGICRPKGPHQRGFSLQLRIKDSWRATLDSFEQSNRKIRLVFLEAVLSVFMFAGRTCVGEFDQGLPVTLPGSGTIYYSVSSSVCLPVYVAQLRRARHTIVGRLGESRRLYNSSVVLGAGSCGL